jgi:hypothetical protein
MRPALTVVRVGGRALLRTVAMNPNTTLFAVGFVAFESGMAQWVGRSGASTVGGLILMMVAAWPMLRPIRNV